MEMQNVQMASLLPAKSYTFSFFILGSSRVVHNKS